MRGDSCNIYLRQLTFQSKVLFAEKWFVWFLKAGPKLEGVNLAFFLSYLKKADFFRQGDF